MWDKLVSKFDLFTYECGRHFILTLKADKEGVMYNLKRLGQFISSNFSYYLTNILERLAQSR